MQQVRSTEVVTNVLKSTGLNSTDETFPLCNFQRPASLQLLSKSATYPRLQEANNDESDNSQPVRPVNQ